MRLLVQFDHLSGQVPLRDLLASDSGTSGGSASIFGGAAYTDGRDLLVFRYC
jgi:hypothetical protein